MPVGGGAGGGSTRGLNALEGMIESLRRAEAIYRVRVLVRDLGSGEFAVRTADVTVDPAGSSLLPVLVADAPGAWLMARESAARRREVPFPFLAGDQPFFPMARPTLPRSGKTDVTVQTYGTSVSDLDARIVEPCHHC